MAKNFDDILKKGKDQATQSLDKKQLWRAAVTGLVKQLHDLNELYDDAEHHHFKVEPIKCSICRAASFVVMVRSIQNSKRLIRYHKAKWKPLAKGGKFHCDKCKDLKG